MSRAKHALNRYIHSAFPPAQQASRHHLPVIRFPLLKKTTDWKTPRRIEYDEKKINNIPATHFFWTFELNHFLEQLRMIWRRCGRARS
jgi:hypothetical protein